MRSEAIWLIVFVVAVLVGPFATLRAVAHIRGRRQSAKDADRTQAQTPSSRLDEDNED